MWSQRSSKGLAVIFVLTEGRFGYVTCVFSPAALPPPPPPLCGALKTLLAPGTDRSSWARVAGRVAGTAAVWVVEGPLGLWVQSACSTARP